MKHQFESFKSWRIVGKNRFRQLLEALYGILYIWLVWGILSLFISVGRLVESFCRREPIAALVIGTVLAVVVWGWIMTYANCQIELTTMRHLNDSLSMELDRYIIDN